MKTDVKQLKEWATYGPKNGKIAPDLVGWTTEDMKFICAKCASAILGRGCRLPIGSEPLWKSQGETLTGKCCVAVCCK